MKHKNEKWMMNDEWWMKHEKWKMQNEWEKRVNAKCTATPLAQPKYMDLMSMEICLTNNSPMLEGLA